MDKLGTEFDLPLVEFINDYAEGRLDPIEQQVFEEYLQTEPAIASFAEKSRKGKSMLNNAYIIKAADNFRQKLARRIAKENSKNMA